MAASHQSSAGDVPRCQVPGCDEALPEDAAYYKVGPTLWLRPLGRALRS